MSAKLNMEQYRRQKTLRREIVVIAVMCALAVLSRSIFYMLPQMKPMAAVVMLTGALCGKRAGAMTGAVSILLSNFLFGQGLWTMFQMMGFVMLGLCAGLFCDKISLDNPKNITLFSVICGILVFGIYGIIVDTGTVVTYMRPLSFETALPVYIAGVPFNLIHGGSTIVFLLLMSKPVARKLTRVKCKYQIFQREKKCPKYIGE